jgi:putative ABC transport system substrate-binding protein
MRTSDDSGTSVRRSLLLVLSVCILAISSYARAQQPGHNAHIGYLGAFTPSASEPLVKAFRQGLRDLGYAEGGNVSIDYRWAEGMPDRLPALAAELINLKVDVIVTQSNAAAGALQQGTKTIPVVVAGMGDPVESGFVSSLARPGGNITGFSNQAEDFAGKWLELQSDRCATYPVS